MVMNEALRGAEDAGPNATVHIHLDANTTYDLSDASQWPHDFGFTRAAVVLQGSGSVLDAQGGVCHPSHDTLPRGTVVKVA